MTRVERKLAAIFAADVAGYSRLVRQDELGTLARLKAARAIVDRLIAKYRGRVFSSAGDSVVADFASAVDAVECAVAVQAALAQEAATSPPAEPALRFRIGVHLGEVVVEGADLLGDGVNIAARLESLAEPGGILVSAAVQEQVGGKLPIGFADLGEQEVKNLPPIRAYAVQAGPASAPVADVAPSLPEKPSIAVLPFQNLSGDPEQEYFADGMVEEIITALSRIRWLFVIARNSSFTYKGQSVDAKRVGRELGVRYLLEGSVRRAAGRVRITAQLIEAETGAHLWADRFDGSLEDVFEVQDTVASSVAGIIEPTLQAAEVRRSAQRPTRDPTAYDLYLRALAPSETGRKEDILEALELLDRATQRDPHYGSALALMARLHAALANTGWAEDLEASRREAVELARRAVQAGGDDPNALGRAAMVFGYLTDDIGSAIALIDRALALNPSFADGWVRSGWLRLWSGEPDIAIDHFQTGLRLNPRDATTWPLLGIGAGHFFARRFEQAIPMLLRSLQERPAWPLTYRFLAASFAHAGRPGEARAVAARLRALTPSVVPSVTEYRRLEDRELFVSGLRLAAGEANEA